LTESERETLQRYERELEEESKREEARRAEASNLFHRSDLLQGASRVYTVEIPELGGFVRFSKLTYGEMQEMNRIENPEEKGLRIIAKMIQKANPEVDDVLGKLLKMDIETVGLISQRIMEASPTFFGKRT